MHRKRREYCYLADAVADPVCTPAFVCNSGFGDRQPRSACLRVASEAGTKEEEAVFCEQHCVVNCSFK